MPRFRRDIRRNALLAAPAVALALAACGGGASDVSSEAASAPAAVTETVAPPETTETTGGAVSSAPADTSAAAAAPLIQRLSADEAIANAEVNQPNLQLADSVLDIETLAVSDGSIQTLRDVVVGDKPVLLWFFSPH